MALSERRAGAKGQREGGEPLKCSGERKASASLAVDREPAPARKVWTNGEAPVVRAASAKRVPAHRRGEDGTPRTAEVSATVSASGNDERHRRVGRPVEASVHRSLLV